MIEVNRNRTKTDEAWEHLYARLEREHLLAKAGSTRIRPLLKWVVPAVAALACLVYLASALWLASDGVTEVPNLVTQENREASTLVTTLEDGSVVYLAQESTLQYPEHFASDRRMVNLQGEAYFDVAGKREQTFQIETEKVRIEVLGTAFNVRSHEADAFSLSVQRGMVKVSLKRGGQSVLVKAGETVVLEAQQLQLSQTKESDAPGRYTRNIRFKDECLEDILKVVNEEAATLRIDVASSALGKRKLTIEFENDSPETVAELISWALGLKCTREANRLILSD